MDVHRGMRYDRIKVVSFDADGTLVDPSFMDRFWFYGIPSLYADKKGVGLREAIEHVTAEYDKMGPEDLRWYLPSYWIEHFGLGVSVTKILNGLAGHLKVYPDVPSALKRLNAKYDLIVASSSPRELLEFELVTIGSYFARVFSSVSDFGQPGKTAAFYLNICDSMGVEPGEMLHVGDQRDLDLEVPSSVGVQALLLDREGVAQDKLVIKSLHELVIRLKTGHDRVPGL